MLPTLLDPEGRSVSADTAARANARIRDLLGRARAEVRELTPVERAEYERLRGVWVQAAART